jgi:hypothetical protein
MHQSDAYRDAERVTSQQAQCFSEARYTVDHMPSKGSLGQSPVEIDTDSSPEEQMDGRQIWYKVWKAFLRPSETTDQSSSDEMMTSGAKELSPYAHSPGLSH